MSYKHKYPDLYTRGQRIGREIIASFPRQELQEHIRDDFATLQALKRALEENVYSQEQRVVIERNAALYEGIVSCYD